MGVRSVYIFKFQQVDTVRDVRTDEISCWNFQVRRKTDFLIFLCLPGKFCLTFDMVQLIMVQSFSLSPTPQASINSLVETTCESPNKSDESQRKLCNSPRNNTNRSQSIKRDSPQPPPTTASLIDDVKKLEICTSDPDLRKFKTNSPLASSSNLSKPDPAENLRLCYNNNENNSRKSELKWQCSVCFDITCFG